MPKKKEVENLSWRDKILLEERTFLVLAVHRLPTHVDLELYDFASAGNFHREFPPHSELEVA